MDFWHSTHFSNWVIKDKSCVDNGNIVHYMINAIDVLSDKLPRSIRAARCQYTAMVYVHRHLQTGTVLDGETSAHIAALCLFVAIAGDAGLFLDRNVWDSAIAKVFPCRVVHRCLYSCLESALPLFLRNSLKFDLHVFHPMDIVEYLIAESLDEENTANTLLSTALGVVNSLYRTSAVLEFPPYVVAIASLLCAKCMHGEEPAGWLASLPVNSSCVYKVISDFLVPFLRNGEFPNTQLPELIEVDSPSSRPTVSRHSSRSGTTQSNRKKRPLEWALLPVGEARPNSSHCRPVSVSELRILRELCRVPNICGIVNLTSVSLYESSPNSVCGHFDSTGTQFDSIIRLLGSYSDLLNVFKDVLSAAFFLNEHKICHYSIEPKNLMISSNNCIKIASLSGASILPSVPLVQPSYEYRAPELLLGPVSRDDSLGVDLWSVGCVLAEIARIFFTRNRYEEPLFNWRNDETIDYKPSSKCPVKDSYVYTKMVYLKQVANILNNGELPLGGSIWPNLTKRVNYVHFKEISIFWKRSNILQKTDTIDNYLKADILTSNIVKALLRWCPNKRTPPNVCLQHIAKFISSSATAGTGN